MNRIIICFLLLTGAMCINAQDKLVLRDGKTFDLKIVRIQDNYVYYVYPGETTVIQRLISGVSYIIYENGKIEIIDKSLRESDIILRNSTSQRTNTTSSVRNAQPDDDGVYWEDVKTTFMESDVSGMTRLKRISAISGVSYKDAIQQLKKKAAEIGGTTILVMDMPEDIDDIEVMGIAYLDPRINTQRVTTERANTQATQPSNVRRRTAQQLGSYTNEQDLQYEAPPRTSSRNTPQREERQPARQKQVENDTPDAVYLLNGRVIRGIIEEYEPDDYVSIRVPTGRVNEYSMDDVRRVSRDNAGASTQQRRPSSRDNAASRPPRSRDYNDYSVSGYKGIFDVGYDLPIGGVAEKGNISINTSHGYQLNEYLFIGAGVGLNIYNARDLQLKTNMSSNEKFPQYVAKSGSIINDSVTYMRAVDSSYMTLPVFLDIRGYMPLQNSTITPFASFRIGYAFNLSDGFGGMGLYMNPAIGVKYQVSPMIGINLSLGYSYQSYGGVPKDGGYGYYYYKNAADKAKNPSIKYVAKGAGGLSIKLGVEF